jgi:hypothetical protein
MYTESPGSLGSLTLDVTTTVCSSVASAVRFAVVAV